MGQLIRRKHLDGSITEYHYYPEIDPIGARGLNTATNHPDTVCGYLARIVRDANGVKIINQYAYDTFGYVTKVFDGKRNPAQLRYNAMGKLESVTSREPFQYRIDYRYDANYNETESIQFFERLEYDDANQRTVVTSSSLREIKEYNALDNVTMRQIVGDAKSTVEYFYRDADENIIRHIQPLGNATEYVYDERNLLIEKIFGAGTNESFSHRFTYTFNGALSSYTDGNGETTAHHYDGYHRYKGFTSPIGTRKTQWFDEADNVVRVEIENPKDMATRKSGVDDSSSVPFMQAKYHFDQWNRPYRVDKAWHDHSTGHPLGKSKWNGETGIVSTVMEYGENGLLAKIWTETNNVVAVEYDGVGRIVKTGDLTGEESFFEYDENNNVTLMKHLGPEVDGRRFEWALRRSYDAMDRLEYQQENDEALERFAYNALGNVIRYVDKSGMEIHYMNDSLGRRVGHAFTITDALDNTQTHKMLRRAEYDDNYRLSAFTDATGKRTMYRYDALDRQTGVVFPDGNAAKVDYDANGNIVRLVDQNKNETNHSYDASNRLVERRIFVENNGKDTVEQYEYDGLSRMIGANGPDARIRLTYDSLSRLLTEEQGDRKLQYAHDSAGNLTRLTYPGGEEVYKSYDIRNRVTAVKNKASETVASFIYRANDQIAKLLLGKVIETDLSYNSQEHLESIEYRSTDDRKLVEGFRYQYDDSGKMTHEIQLSEGSTYGDRYYYDIANRETKARYGVQDVFDPSSSFEQETSYEHFPEGSWKRRLDIDGLGQIIADAKGTINQLNKYQRFGSLSFQYDANGNCIKKGKANPGYCLYTYDYDNKLIKVECYGSDGVRTKIIEYFYDLLVRQVRKVVTDQNGTITEYTYVWAGKLLIEEYENGVLVCSYLYGIGSRPVQLTVSQGRISNYYYTHNGRGLASGLLHENAPISFAERYGYELSGASFVREINGVTVGFASRGTKVSNLANSILSGGYLKDWANGSLSSIGGIHSVPEISAILNGLSAEFGKLYVQQNSASVLGRQLQGFLNVLGLGGFPIASTSGRTPDGNGIKGALPLGAKNPRDQSWYGWVSTPGMNPPDFGGRTPPHRPDGSWAPAMGNLGKLAGQQAVKWMFGRALGSGIPGSILLFPPSANEPNEDINMRRLHEEANERYWKEREAAEAKAAKADAKNDPPPSSAGDYPLPAGDGTCHSADRP
jgi:YD repeat-containing protein